MVQAVSRQSFTTEVRIR